MVRSCQLHQFIIDLVDELSPLIGDGDIGAAKPAVIINSEILTNRITNHFYLTIQGLLKAHVLGSYPAQSDQGLGVGLGLGLGSGLGLCPQK